MRPRLPRRIPRPAPATIIAVVALVLAAGGFAVAAIPEPSGKIHACYRINGGALRVVPGTTCAQGEKPLSWNQGVSSVIVRKASVTVKWTCPYPGPVSGYTCVGTGSNAAVCVGHERATGGGFDGTTDSNSYTLQASRPGPTSGTPNRWFVALVGSGTSSTQAHADTHVPVYVVCAA